MLLDKEVKVSIKYNYDLDYYKNLGYKLDKEYFFVKIEDLPKKSFTKVNVKCEYCYIEEFIPYYKWNRSMESPVKKYCCKNCKGEKIKESNILKYGVTSVAKLESSKRKAVETSLEKWGVRNHLMSTTIKEKIKNTNREKWGVENPMQMPEIRKKQSEKIKQKWGVCNISKLDDIKEKKCKTTFSNFGVLFPLQSEDIKEKVRSTNFKKFGNEYFTKTETWRKNNYDIARDEFYIRYIDKNISLFKCDYKLDHNFEISKDVYCKRKLYNIPLCSVCNPISDNRSIKEKELFNFILSSYSGEVINNWRDGKMEIDIYLPQVKIGFEFNGLYWHSDIYKEKNFHLKKTEFFNKKGIRIIHIWEDDWDFKKSIIKSQVSNLLKLNKKIWARKCYVKEIKDNNIVRDFLDKNHIQGYVNSIIKLGLYLDEELVSIMTFDHLEGRKKMTDVEWNLSRFCNKLDTSVIGGASKLFKYFIENYTTNRVISYADKDWSSGNLYDKLGFNLVKCGKPDYKYLVGGKRVHKSGFRKSKTNISESNLLIPRIWDCGKIKFEKIFY